MRELSRPAAAWGRTVVLAASLTVGIAAGLLIAFSLIRRLLEFLTL
ncbi:MAG: hypothetical protein ACYTA3_00250 [Planctomycetota bacterium]|jgi:hypothetical protein